MLVSLFYLTMIVIARSLRRESSLDVGEQTAGETTRRRNDRLPYLLTANGSAFFLERAIFSFNMWKYIFLLPEI